MRARRVAGARTTVALASQRAVTAPGTQGDPGAAARPGNGWEAREDARRPRTGSVRGRRGRPGAGYCCLYGTPSAAGARERPTSPATAKIVTR